VPEDARLPVIVGVGQLRSNRERTVADAREPLDLMVAACERAAADAGAPELLGRADSIDIVNIISWAYDEPAALLARRIGATPAHAAHSAPGGNRPVELLDRAAQRVAAGESSVALVAGGEALASLSMLLKQGETPRWSQQPGGPARPDIDAFTSPLMLRYNMIMPVTVYPLYENALRASLGQDFDVAQQWSAQMYAAMTRVAARNEAAWDPVERTPEEIVTASERNRWICHPYPLLMNALLMVDQASAVIVTSLGAARDVGISDDKIVHIWGGAGRSDSSDIFERPGYDHSPAIQEAFDEALKRTGLSPTDLDVLDLYSCFPVVPKLALLALGLPPETPTSVTGGLTAFGGPANNYCGHAVVAAVRRLRDGGRNAFVYGNGELVTKHSAIVLSRSAHPDGYVGEPEVLAVDAPHPPVRDDIRGAASVETYTVEYDRAGTPVKGFVIGRAADGVRFPALSFDPPTLRRLVDPTVQCVGRLGVATEGKDGLTEFAIR
jgi:acetyl-CoA C-acetyltransferase